MDRIEFHKIKSTFPLVRLLRSRALFRAFNPVSKGGWEATAGQQIDHSQMVPVKCLIALEVKMVDPRNSVNFLAGLLIRKDPCCRQPLMSPAFWNNTPVSDRIDLLALTSDPSRCCGEGTKECWGELSALSRFFHAMISSQRMEMAHMCLQLYLTL